MSQKKPLSVFLSAIELMLLGGGGVFLYSSGLFQILSNDVVKDPKFFMFLIEFAVRIIFYLTFIITGIFLFNFKKKAQKTAIVLLVLQSLVFFHFFSEYQFAGSCREFADCSTKYYQFFNLSKLLFSLPYLLPVLVLTLLPIYYLTRPKIKELFQ